MDIVETLNRSQIGEHKPSKTPFITQNLLQQEWVGRDRDAVDLVIGRHDAECVSLRERPVQSLAASIIRSSRSPMCTGEVLVPPSGEPWPAKCLGSATTL